jgi:erythromycin esterase-like protein
MQNHDDQLLRLLNQSVQPVNDSPHGLDSIINQIGDARFVLIGEASHGTHEFYAIRAEITRRLINDKNFTAVVVEADWPDAYRVNRYVRGYKDDGDAEDALGDFQRFPQWMWRNADVVRFVQWLRDHNEARSDNEIKTGFYGMDLYSLFGSIQEVLHYLEKVDPAAATRARFRYGCFDHFSEDPQAYGYAASFDLDQSCQQQVVQQLIEIRQHASEFARRDGRMAEDEYFYVEQNARLIKNAEEYYRAMFQGRVSSWNLRDRHMTETLEALVKHLEKRDGSAKVVVWAHNSHLGDASATEMGDQGEFNVGQLVREHFGKEECSLIGFSTYTGVVTAATDWGGDAERKRVRRGLSGSYEEIFHKVGKPQFLLDIRNATAELAKLLREPRLQRAIGVIYRPETERMSHYFHTRLADQFDLMIHIDETRAVEPLEPTWQWSRDLPETYPMGV